MANLNDFMTAEGIAQMHGSWLAYSTSSLLFDMDGDKLLLGVRAMPPEAIPEVGDLCLPGGFNTYVPAPAMWAAAADAWLLANLGLQPDPANCSDFLPCEYDMTEIADPLKTSVGPLHIKRVAFQRLGCLTEEQAESIRPQNRLKGVYWASRSEFEGMVEEGRRLSFPHQFEQVRAAFNIVRQVDAGNIGKLRATWALPSLQPAIKRPWSEHS